MSTVISGALFMVYAAFKAIDAPRHPWMREHTYWGAGLIGAAGLALVVGGVW